MSVHTGDVSDEDAPRDDAEATSEPHAPATDLVPLPRAVMGGVMMGLANLVPGISGGTMLLAAGVYPRFIRAIAELSTLKFRRASLLVLGAVVTAALAAILLFAGPVKDLVVEHRWVMYSLFIGLTLGGIPIVWRLAKPASPSLWGGVAVGFATMVLIAYLQMSSPDASVEREGFVMMLLAGVAGASAMILPGISGGYLLLVMGVYVPILGAIDQVKDALKAGDMAAALGPGLEVVLPVGLGVLVGVLGVSNVLEYLLKRFEKPTLGALLGFLVGAVLGLWPFQRGIAPEVGDRFRGQVLTAESLAELDPSKYPTEFFSPGAVEAVAALGLVLLGLAITSLVARMGRDKPKLA